MIIRKVQLEPFGAFSGRVCQLEPGLNVVLGPNEAGKTTLVNAIHAALFVPASVKKNSTDWKNLITRYLPHPHGDTARVVLEFAVNKDDVPHRLCCAWGAEKEARLLLNDGGEISEERSVRKKLEELLRHGRGTYEAVLMARQAELVNTLERVRKEKEALNTLADMLRAVIFHSSGVSVDELESKLAEKKRELENNWDFHRDGPRDGRDIDNPHRRNLGLILEQYYQVQTIKQRLKEARRAEEAYENAARRLQEVEAEYREVENQEKEMKKLEQDVNRRNVLEPQLNAWNLKQDQLKKLIQEWPKTEEKIEYLEKDKKKQEAEKEKFAAELKLSQKEQEIKVKREIYNHSLQLKEQLEQKQEQLNNLPQVTPDQLENLETKEKELASLKAQIGGMKLKIRMVAKEAMEIKISSGLQEEKTLSAEGENTFEAEGRFNLEAPGWSLQVQSGEKDVETLLKQMKQLENEIQEPLHNLGVADISEARIARRQVGELESKINELQGRLQDTLKGHSFEELKKELAEVGEEKVYRDPSEVSGDLTRAEVTLQNITRELEQMREKLNQWQEEYGSYDSVLDAMGEARSEINKISKELQKLAPLPENYADAEAFLRELQMRRGKKEELNQTLSACKEEKIRAENNVPEESPEELQKALQDAQNKLQVLKEEAAALRKVEEEFYHLKRELDADTFRPMQDLFLEYLYPLTGYRYGHAHMEGALPEGVASGNQSSSIPVDLLSFGTISGVALALRLAMARYLLKEGEGFIIMDDPMVDLDPERKRQAAEILQRIGQEKQIIVTTFDPDTAELLKGNLVKL